MEHKSSEVLREELKNAGIQVPTGTLWSHFKNPEHYYEITGLVVIEETDEIGVLYKATFEPTKGITFLRPLESFLGYKETDNGKVKRFNMVSK